MGTRPWVWSQASGPWGVPHPSRAHGLQAAAPGENTGLREATSHLRDSPLTRDAGERKSQGTPLAKGGAGSPRPMGSDAVPPDRAVQAEITNTECSMCACHRAPTAPDAGRVETLAASPRGEVVRQRDAHTHCHMLALCSRGANVFYPIKMVK